MTPTDLLNHIGDLTKQASHPNITNVTHAATGSLRIESNDGSAQFVKIAHLQPRGSRQPDAPTWPDTTGGVR